MGSPSTVDEIQDLAPWQKLLQPFCESIRCHSEYNSPIEYQCKCGSRKKALPKSLIRQLKNNNTLKCRSCAATETVNNPQYKERQRVEIKGRFKDPVYLEKHAEANRKKWLEPDIRNRITKAMRAQSATRSRESKERWENPEYRRKLTEYHSREDVKSSRRESALRHLTKHASEAGRKTQSLRRPAILENRRVMIEAHLNMEQFEVLGIGASKIKIRCRNCSRIYNRAPHRLGRACLCVSHPCTTQNSIANQLLEWEPQTIKIKGKDSAGALVKRELDIALNNGYAIEYCGLLWHSEGYGKGRMYHYGKMLIAQENGYNLITIFEDEWRSRGKQVISTLRAGFGNRVQGGRCVEIDPQMASEFINNHHLRPIDPILIHRAVGIYKDSKLVYCVTLSIDSRRRYFISRIGYKQDVVDGISRALMIIRGTTRGTIHMWTDNRWTTGEEILEAGFILSSVTPPQPYYCRRGTRRRKPGGESDWTRIWDCGGKRWLLKL